MRKELKLASGNLECWRRYCLLLAAICVVVQACQNISQPRNSGKSADTSLLEAAQLAQDQTMVPRELLLAMAYAERRFALDETEARRSWLPIIRWRPTRQIEPLHMQFLATNEANVFSSPALSLKAVALKLTSLNKQRNPATMDGWHSALISWNGNLTVLANVILMILFSFTARQYR